MSFEKKFDSRNTNDHFRIVTIIGPLQNDLELLNSHRLLFIVKKQLHCID